MTKETRIRADRELRDNHLRKTITWYNLKLDKVEEALMNVMKGDPSDIDTSLIGSLIKERDCIIQSCKEVSKKLYG